MGRLAIVTGANTGIGRCIAQALASAGYKVVLACRSPERGESAAAAIRAAGGDATAAVLDLRNLASVRSFASSFNDRPLEVLVNNAGMMAATHETTEDGFESTWQVNTLGPFLLARLLVPNLAAAATAAGNRPGSARVIYVGSRLEKRGTLADLELVDVRSRFLGAQGPWSTFGAYGTSKLAGTALTYELARRLPAGVTACVMTPGIVNTELGRFAPLLVRALTWPLRLWLMRTPSQGADTAIWLATAAECAETQNGKYYYERSVIESSDASRDQENAAKLWETIEAQAPLVSLLGCMP